MIVQNLSSVNSENPVSRYNDRSHLECVQNVCDLCHQLGLGTVSLLFRLNILRSAQINSKYVHINLLTLTSLFFVSSCLAWSGRAWGARPCCWWPPSACPSPPPGPPSPWLSDPAAPENNRAMRRFQSDNWWYLETGQTVTEQVLLLPQVSVGPLPSLDEVSAGRPHQQLQVTPQLLRQVPEIFKRFDKSHKDNTLTSGGSDHGLGGLLPWGGGVHHVCPGVPGEPVVLVTQLAAAGVYHNRPRLNETNKWYWCRIS